MFHFNESAKVDRSNRELWGAGWTAFKTECSPTKPSHSPQKWPVLSGSSRPNPERLTYSISFVRNRVASSNLTFAFRAKGKTRGADDACDQALHIVDKPRRHSEMPRCLTVSVTFLHKRNDTRTQHHRRRLADDGSPSMAQVNHKLSARES